MSTGAAGRSAAGARVRPSARTRTAKADQGAAGAVGRHHARVHRACVAAMTVAAGAITCGTGRVVGTISYCR